jgi:hypothetical protein
MIGLDFQAVDRHFVVDEAQIRAVHDWHHDLEGNDAG